MSNIEITFGLGDFSNAPASVPAWCGNSNRVARFLVTAQLLAHVGIPMPGGLPRGWMSESEEEEEEEVKR